MSNNLKKIQIIKTLVLKQKVKHHFMKHGDIVLEGDKHQNDSLFLFSTSRFQSFFVSRMSVEEKLVEKLQRQSKVKLEKLKEEQERLRERQKFTNILPLQSRSLERGPPFLLQFIIFLLLRNPFQYPSLKELLK